MRIEEYKEISNNVQVPDCVMASYEIAMEKIKDEVDTNKKSLFSKWKGYNMLSKAAIICGVFLVLSGSTIMSVKAYISHLERMENMEAEEVIDLYAAGYRKVIENHMDLLENDAKEAQGGHWYGSENH